MTNAPTADRTRRIRNSAIVLALVAVAFFAAFIVAALLRSQGA